MIQSVDFETMNAWLPDALHPKKYDLLGRESFVVCYAPDINHIVAIGSNGDKRCFTKEVWAKICNYLDNLLPNEREHGYNFTQWKFGPTVPALCRAYCECHNQ